MSASRKLGWIAAVFLLAAAGSTAYLLLSRGDAAAVSGDVVSAEETEPPVPVEVVEAVRGQVAATLSTSSTLEAEQSAQILAKVGGVVTRVDVREGAYVEKGQVLAKIDEEEKRIALEKAELSLKKAEAELHRATLSFEQKLISKFDHDKAVFDRDIARNEREKAELELRYTEVHAPFAGRVTAKEVVAGKAIQPGDHLFSLADFGTLVARLYLPEKDVYRLRPGQPVRLLPEARRSSAKADADASFSGRVRDIGPVVDPKTGTVKVTVEVLDRKAVVRPGAFVRAEIETDRRVDAVLVPKACLVSEQGRDFIFVADGGLARKRQVKGGYARNGAIEIEEGVKAGEKVIVSGQSALADGDRIEAIAPR